MQTQMQKSKWLAHTKEEGECLLWTRCLNTDGYPRAFVSGNSNVKVHREVFFDTHGYYPEVVRHTCDNPSCISPQHLVAGTSLENVFDRHFRQRTHNQVSKTDQETCEQLRSQGLTYRQIADQLQTKVKRVEYILTRLRKES